MDASHGWVWHQYLATFQANKFLQEFLEIRVGSGERSYLGIPTDLSTKGGLLIQKRRIWVDFHLKTVNIWEELDWRIYLWNKI